MTIRFHDGPVDRVETGTLVVGHYEGERPLQAAAGELDWRFHGWLSRLMLDERLDTEFGSCLLLPANRLLAERVLLVGLGDPKELGTRRLAELTSTVQHKISGLKETRLALALPPCRVDEDGVEAWARALYRSLVQPLAQTSGINELVLVAEPQVIAKLKNWMDEAA